MYLLLDEAGQQQLRAERLLTLEREHYRIALQLAEMDAVGVPADNPGRSAALGDLQAVEATINWHRSEIDPPQRVEPEVEPTGSDDGAEGNTLGEERT